MTANSRPLLDSWQRVPGNASLERVRILQACGANIIHNDPGEANED